MKTIFNSKLNRVEVKDGRKVVASLATTLTEATLNGIIAGLDPEVTDPEAILVLVQSAIDEATRRKGSVIPDDYRYRYGADQNCGDAVAKALTDKVTDPKTGVDLEACRSIAAINGVEDRFDVWMDKDLNPGMVRMNLGNVLRGMARRGEPVMGLGLEQVEQAD